MKERILQYMMEEGSITTLEAMRDLGCCDLQHYIRVLRQEYIIKDEWVKAVNRYGDKVSFKRYFLDNAGTNNI